MIKYNIPVKSSQEDSYQPKVTIMGVGGAGINIIDRIAIVDDHNVDIYALDSDIRTLNASVSRNKVQLGEGVTKGLGTGGDPELGIRSILESEEKIVEILEKTEMLFIISGLGGGTSCGAVPRVTEIAYKNNIFVVSVMIVPFSFEGNRRRDQAINSLEDIKKYSNALLTFDNNKIGELILPKKGIQEAFKSADELICQSVKSVIDIIIKPNALIKISVADILATLQSHESRCLFGYGESESKNRTMDALKKALKSPLLDSGDIIKNAKNVIIHICGGEKTTLYEVELLMQEIQDKINKDAQIYLGITIDPALKEKFCLTILSSLSADTLLNSSITEDEEDSQIIKNGDSEDHSSISKKVSLKPILNNVSVRGKLDEEKESSDTHDSLVLEDKQGYKKRELVSNVSKDKDREEDKKISILIPKTFKEESKEENVDDVDNVDNAVEEDLDTISKDNQVEEVEQIKDIKENTVEKESELKELTDKVKLKFASTDSLDIKNANMGKSHINREDFEVDDRDEVDKDNDETKDIKVQDLREPDGEEKIKKSDTKNTNAIYSSSIKDLNSKSENTSSGSKLYDILGAKNIKDKGKNKDFEYFDSGVNVFKDSKDAQDDVENKNIKSNNSTSDDLLIDEDNLEIPAFLRKKKS